MRPPTEKQLEFAAAIAARLGIEMPAERTRQSLYLFIREHRPRFDETQRKSRRTGHDWTDMLDPQEDQDMFWAFGGDPVTGCLGDD